MARQRLVALLDDSLQLSARGGRAARRPARRRAQPRAARRHRRLGPEHGGAFASSWAAQRGELFLAWRGSTPADVRPGGLGSVCIDVFAPGGDGSWMRTSCDHVQRHWTRATVERLSAEAGLAVVAVRGQLPGAVLEDDLGDDRHTKAVYVAIRRTTGGD